MECNEPIKTRRIGGLKSDETFPPCIRLARGKFELTNED